MSEPKVSKATRKRIDDYVAEFNKASLWSPSPKLGKAYAALMKRLELLEREAAAYRFLVRRR